MSKAPTTFNELKQFYVEEYRPLYDRFISEGCVAQELHTEIAAGVDHLLLSLSESGVSAKDCERASAHFKRATFDAFKLIYEKRIRSTYERLKDSQYCNVHDGRFHSEIAAKWYEAVEIATSARRMESLSRKDDYESWGSAFEEWKKILPLAQYFSEQMTSPDVTRVPVQTRNQKRKALFVNLGFTLLGAVIGAVLGKIF